jgi:hypothetical protein
MKDETEIHTKHFLTLTARTNSLIHLDQLGKLTDASCSTDSSFMETDVSLQRP